MEKSNLEERNSEESESSTGADSSRKQATQEQQHSLEQQHSSRMSVSEAPKLGRGCPWIYTSEEDIEEAIRVRRDKHRWKGFIINDDFLEK